MPLKKRFFELKQKLKHYSLFSFLLTSLASHTSFLNSKQTIIIEFTKSKQETHIFSNFKIRKRHFQEILKNLLTCFLKNFIPLIPSLLPIIPL